MNIYNIIDEELDLQHLALKQPKRIHSGTYFSQICYNDTEFYINTPKCNTKKGIVQTNSRTYVDMVYKENNEFIKWILKLEKRIKELLFEKSNLWFQNELSLDDIDYFYNSSIKINKKNEYMVRCYVAKQNKLNKENQVIQIYDENNNIKDYEDVGTNEILSILQVKGIRFTDTSFHLELQVEQIMILNTKPKLFHRFLIKKPGDDIHINEDVKPKEDKEKSDNDDSIQLIQNNDNDSDVDNHSGSYSNIDDNDNNNQIIQNNDNSNGDERENNNNDNNTSERYIKNIENEIIDTNEDNNTDTTINTNTLDATINLGNDTSNSKNNKQNIALDIETLEEDNTLEKPNSLEEVVINTNNVKEEETLKLKKPNEVYYEIYKEARRKAKEAKKAALIAYLEAKNIKKTYMLEDIDDSSDESNFSDNESNNEEIEYSNE